MLPIRSWSTAAPAWPNTGVAGPGCPSRAFIPDLPERWMIAGCLRLSGRLCREAPGGRERPLRGCETRRAEVWLSGSYRESGRSAEGRERHSNPSSSRHSTTTAAGSQTGRPQHPRHRSLNPSAGQVRRRLLHAGEREFGDCSPMTAPAAKQPSAAGCLQPLRFGGRAAAAVSTGHWPDRRLNDRCTALSGSVKLSCALSSGTPNSRL